MPALGHKYICGLDVTMDNTFRVSCIERIRNLDGQRQCSVGLQWSACNTVLQGEPVQKLHDNERLTIVLADFVDRADVGVLSNLKFQGGPWRGSGIMAP